MLILGFAITFCIIYIIQILFFILGWSRLSLRLNSRAAIQKFPTCCIVVSARNEELNIRKLLSSLSDLLYPPQYLQVIIVDDFSEDQTANIVRIYPQQNIQLLKMADVLGENQSSFSGKKQALDYAIKYSNAEIILCTDADCVVEPNWVNTMVQCFEEESCKYVTGPILYDETPAFIKFFQELDLMSLNAVTAACIGNQWPVMSNGANMAFRRSDYLEVNATRKDLHISTGDDMFLMHSIHKQFPGSVYYQNTSAVTTSAAADIQTFWNQRVRWLSKRFSFTDFRIPGMLIFNFLYSFFCVCLLIMGLFDFQYGIYFTVLYLVKTISDAVFLVRSYPRKLHKILLFIPVVEVLYLLYVLLVGIASRFGRFSWKGRAIKYK